MGEWDRDTGRRRSGRRPHRRASVAVLIAALACLAAGGAAFGASATFSRIAAGGSAAQSAGSSKALAVLAALTVKGKSPLTGYRRTVDFGAPWLDVDRNGCDTRDDILRRDLTGVTGTRCTVRSGTLDDPYTNRVIHFVRGERTSSAVQIDHLVPLADAWQTGAQRLSAARRIDLANDPINLLAVDGPTNESKGDGDAATWLPPVKAFRCTYVAHQVGVKKAYDLWVTPAEKAAMARVLATCPNVTVPVSTVSHVVLSGYSTTVPTAKATPTASASASAPATATATPIPVATTSASTTTGDSGVVHPGAYCSPAGATGHTTAGTAMVCATASDGRLRWRSAD